MAASATFELITPPTSPTDVGHLSGAFVGAGRKYQMIPTGGRSTWRVRFKGGTVRITSKNANAAALGDGQGNRLPRNLLSLNSVNEKTVDFTILAGQGPDRTVLVAEDAKGGNLDTLTISVKTVLPKTYMIHRIVNPTMKTNRNSQDLETMLRTVKATYLAQANADLTQIGPVNDLLITNDYGDPINLSNRRPRHGGAAKQETVNFNEDVLDTLKRKFKFGKADFHMVSTCQMHGPLGTTPNFKNVCYVAHSVNGNALEPESTTWAHELGHAFQLVHLGHNVSEMMAEGNVAGHQNSFSMTDDDIDKINPSGL